MRSFVKWTVYACFFEKMFTVYLRRETCAFFSHKSYHLTVSIVNKSVNYYVELYGTFLY